MLGLWQSNIYLHGRNEYEWVGRRKKSEITYPTSTVTLPGNFYFHNNLVYYHNMFLILNWFGL